MAPKTIRTWQRLPRAVIRDALTDLNHCLAWNSKHPERGLFDSTQQSAVFLVINALSNALDKKSTLSPAP